MNIDKRITLPETDQAPYVRIVQIDVLRGFALLGIYWVNIFIFALPVGLGPLPAELNDSSGINTLMRLISDVLVEGTMRGLFSILFGASALLFLDEARLATSGLDLVDRYYRRTVLLILFGVIHAYVLLWPYDVLYAYGLLGLFLFPLRKLSAKSLLLFGLALLIVGDFNLQELRFGDGLETRLGKADILDYDESASPSVLARDAESKVSSPTLPEVIADESTRLPDEVGDSKARDSVSKRFLSEAEITTYRDGYLTIFTHQIGVVIDKQSNTMYLDYLYDIGGMMLIGMALFKLGVLSGQLARRTYLLFAVLGYSLGIILRLATAYSGLEFGNRLIDPVLHYSASYNVSRVIMTMGHIGLVGLLCYSSWLRFITRMLASVGRMALTNYIMQTVISIFLFYGFGFGLFALLERSEVAVVCLGVWVFQIAFSTMWLRWFKQGPLEWVWRSLIYGQLQPNRKVKRTV